MANRFGSSCFDDVVGGQGSDTDPERRFDHCEPPLRGVVVVFDDPAVESVPLGYPVEDDQRGLDLFQQLAVIPCPGTVWADVAEPLHPGFGWYTEFEVEPSDHSGFVIFEVHV